MELYCKSIKKSYGRQSYDLIIFIDGSYYLSNKKFLKINHFLLKKTQNFSIIT